MLALWLAVCGFFFRVPLQDDVYWGTTSSAALSVAVCALVSLGRGARRWHLIIVVVGVALIVLARAMGTPVPAEWQAVLVTAGLLVMTAVLPTRSDRPPAGWTGHAEALDWGEARARLAPGAARQL